LRTAYISSSCPNHIDKDLFIDLSHKPFLILTQEYIYNGENISNQIEKIAYFNDKKLFEKILVKQN